METLHAIPYLREIMIILVAAGILVPLFNRLKISPVLGYLAVGFLVGPYGLSALAGSQSQILHYVTINNIEDVSHLAEFGIVFLMFMIGLELSPKRLWGMRRFVFGLGALQVIVTGAIISGIAFYLFDRSLASSIVIGACMALSSTAIVMQILADRHLIAAPVGRSSFSILLFQDIAVVPLLILIGIMGGNSTESISAAVMTAALKAFAAILALYLIGHFALRPLFRLAGSARGAEPFMAATLLTVIVASLVTGMAGLSMALGAFLGGLLLADTEYRHSIEVYIEPFKGLLLGLFFMTVGMGIDPGVIRYDLPAILACVAGLILLKTAVTGSLGLAFGLSRGAALETGMLLSQAGEFAFVIIGVAKAANIITAPFGQFLFVVAGLSMVATPFVAMGASRLAKLADKKKVKPVVAVSESLHELSDHVVIAGFGRVGRAVSSILAAEGVSYLAVETDANVVDEQRKAGQPVIFGDASRDDFLKHCNIEQAQAVLVTMADMHISSNVVRSIRHHWPHISVFTRASDLAAAKALNKAGSTVVVAETVEASLQLAASLLRGIGAEEDIVMRRLELSREIALNRIYQQD